MIWLVSAIIVVAIILWQKLFNRQIKISVEIPKVKENLAFRNFLLTLGIADADIVGNLAILKRPYKGAMCIKWRETYAELLGIIGTIK